MTYVLLANTGVVHDGSCPAVTRAQVSGTDAPMTEIPPWMAASGLSMGHYSTCKACPKTGNVVAVAR